MNRVFLHKVNKDRCNFHPVGEVVTAITANRGKDFVLVNISDSDYSIQGGGLKGVHVRMRSRLASKLVVYGAGFFISPACCTYRPSSHPP